ncbi:hypothetical protein DFH06DRAFT_1129098 [Mycena polygramma]|nr:hypothetical protein DFH06DRAFT_1129098 [Mycena polygramma]
MNTCNEIGHKDRKQLQVVLAYLTSNGVSSKDLESVDRLRTRGSRERPAGERWHNQARTASVNLKRSTTTPTCQTTKAQSLRGRKPRPSSTRSSNHPKLPVAMLLDLEADRSRIAEIDSRILELERSLSGLRAQKTLAEDRLESYKYPVLTLPNEIVSEIFIRFLPVYPICPPLTGVLSPTSLTHICRQWRQIALTMPELWRAIALLENDASLEHPHQYGSISNMWLQRSLFTPLSIHIGCLDPQNSLPNLLSDFVPHRSRRPPVTTFEPGLVFEKIPR